MRLVNINSIANRPGRGGKKYCMEGGLVFRQLGLIAPRCHSGSRFAKITATPIYKPISTHLSIFAAIAGQTQTLHRPPVFPSL